MVRKDDVPAGVVLFNLLEEVMVRNTRPYIRAAYPNATIRGKPVAFPNRRLHTVEYDLGATYGGLYDEIVAAIDSFSLAPYKLEAYKKKSAITDTQGHEWETGRELALVGIFKTRFLKRLESSIEAFRLSLRRALTFEETYKDYLLDRKVVSSKDFQRALRFVARDEEDDIAAGSMADELDAAAEAKEYIESLPTADLNQYELRKLTHDVEADVKLLKSLYARTEGLAESEGKLERLKELLAGDLKGKKVLIFSTFKDTTRYLHKRLTGDAKFLKAAGNPHIRRIDSGNHPNERGHIIGQFAPVASGLTSPPERQIDILISTDVLSEGQNLQDCGLIINYDLTWNPIRLVQRNGRIDRIGSPHSAIAIYNLFPEAELEALLHLIERLTDRISTGRDQPCRASLVEYDSFEHGGGAEKSVPIHTGVRHINGGVVRRFFQMKRPGDPGDPTGQRHHHTEVKAGRLQIPAKLLDAVARNVVGMELDFDQRLVDFFVGGDEPGMDVGLSVEVGDGAKVIAREA
jgi:hypothetical protein